MKFVTRSSTVGAWLVAVGSLTLTVFWACITLPALLSPAPTGLVAVSELAPLGEPRVNDQGRIETFLGCAGGTDTASLDRFFAAKNGPVLGWDNAHVTTIGRNRSLWLMHDTYLDYVGDAETLLDIGGQIQNVAMIQTGSCFTLQHGGVPLNRENFELGDSRVGAENFLWPLGSEVDGDRIWVFWGETANAETETVLGDGLTRYPTATWLAEYDIETMERLSFEPAPNPGVDPVYGFAVSSDDTHSYLFGNTNQLNLTREGGFYNGPHSATRMYIARVPKGRLNLAPEYWDGEGWSDVADDAEPFSERFYTENLMQPRFVDGRWLSVVQADGYFGSDVYLESAENPWGPWVTSEVVTYEARPSVGDKNSYQPIILPSSSPDAGVQIVISENGLNWAEAIATPSMYRPRVFDMAWPNQSERVVEARRAVGSDSDG